MQRGVGVGGEAVALTVDDEDVFVAQLLAGIVGIDDDSPIRSIGVRAIGVFAAGLVLAGVAAALISPLIIRLYSIAPESVGAMQAAVVVPESATILFAGGFPRVPEPFAREATQRAIFQVQRNLEDVQAALYPDRVQLCDRGTVDGGAYWPAGPDDFFAHVGSSHTDELARTCTRVAQKLHSQYVLGFTPTRRDGDARLRKASAAAASRASRRARPRACWC